MAAGLMLAAGCIWALAVVILWRRSRQGGERFDLDVLAGGVLFLLTAGFFWRTITGDVYQPADGGDLVSFLFPTYRFAASRLAQGELPLWNPHLYGGAPFIADIQAGFLYLPNLLLFLLNPQFPYTALQWLAIGHLYWTGLGMYVLLRVLRWPQAPVMRPAALFGAIAFQYSDPLLIHLGNLNLIAVLSWLPWVFAAYVLAMEQKRLAWAGVAGVLFALANYAGHAQSSLYLGLGLVVYTALRVAAASSRRETARQAVPALLIVAGLAALLSAPILLPAVELAGYTARSEFVYQDTVGYSLAPAQAIGLLTPGFFGRGPALHWGLWDRVETPYAGVAAMLLAAAALLLASGRVRRELWPWVGLGLFGFVAALGVYAVVHGWLTVLLPGFGQFRAPARALALWTFAVATLGAVGVDLAARRDGAAEPGDASARPALLDAMLRTGALVWFGVVLPLAFLALLLTQESETIFLRASVAALALALAAGLWAATWALIGGRRAGWWSPAAFGLLMAGLLFFDLAATGAYTDISERDPSAGFEHPEITAFLQSEPGPFRIDTRTGIEGLWQPDGAALHGLQDVGGIANPLLLQHWDALWESTGGRHTRLYDMFNVEYVLAEDGVTLPEGKFEPALDAPGPLAVYRNRTALPRAWVVYAAATAPDLPSALEAIRQPDFDPEQMAVLTAPGNDPPALPAELAASAAAPGGDAATVTAYSGGNRLAFDVEAAAPGVLVISEVWYPGWYAAVNGKAVDVWAANGGLRAVAVPAGRSTVELVFRPLPWRIGIGAALAGLMGLAALLWIESGRPKARRRK